MVLTCKMQTERRGNGSTDFIPAFGNYVQGTGIAQSI
jgi:hypothetical protein